ncbi:MAG TPA: DNA cytosine methyltransferase [Solirubrobacterales bacterium]|jgi:DNA (cytosine-5)-methyltransferase 1|nr:DNA cytosine methyltransferase [Solirubrobacterales bacterium]
MAERRPEWTQKRPATTVVADPRISTPRAYRKSKPRSGKEWASQFEEAVRVNVEEAAVLQGFRADYPWQGSRTRCFLQVGNAVCPPVARLVVEAVSRHSLDRGEGER